MPNILAPHHGHMSILLVRKIMLNLVKDMDNYLVVNRGTDVDRFTFKIDENPLRILQVDATFVAGSTTLIHLETYKNTRTFDIHDPNSFEEMKNFINKAIITAREMNYEVVFNYHGYNTRNSCFKKYKN